MPLHSCIILTVNVTRPSISSISVFSAPLCPSLTPSWLAVPCYPWLWHTIWSPVALPLIFIPSVSFSQRRFPCRDAATFGRAEESFLKSHTKKSVCRHNFQLQPTNVRNSRGSDEQTASHFRYSVCKVSIRHTKLVDSDCFILSHSHHASVFVRTNHVPHVLLQKCQESYEDN